MAEKLTEAQWRASTLSRRLGEIFRRAFEEGAGDVVLNPTGATGKCAVMIGGAFRDRSDLENWLGYPEIETPKRLAELLHAHLTERGAITEMALGSLSPADFHLEDRLEAIYVNGVPIHGEDVPYLQIRLVPADAQSGRERH